jgi:3-carboxy-cis,cis-muconate cycloisomerase
MTFSALDSQLTGPLFATEAMRACFSDEARLAAMLATEAALARAEARFILAPLSLSPAIADITAASLDAAAIGRETELAGVPTIPFVKAAQSRLPPDLERSFHKGATTQDVLDTALVLQIRQALAMIGDELSRILEALALLAKTHCDTPCVGRTYGQHGAPLTFGFKVAVWLAGIAEVAERLPAIRRRMLVASLSGPVGTLTSLGDKGPQVLEAFAQELRLAAEPIAWHARRSRIAETGSWLAQLIGTLAKMATDIANLATTEVAEVAEPYLPGRGGSTAMPHKRNPVSCTVILAAHGAAPGHAASLLTSMAAAHERPAGLWHAEWHALPTLFGLASGALREARTLSEGIEVDKQRMRENLDATHGLLFADAAAARIGAKLGREAAHALVEHAAGEVRRSRTKLRDVLERDPALVDAGIDLEPAFDLSPAISAAATWVDRAISYAADIRASFLET